MLGWYIKLKKNHRQCFMCHQIFFYIWNKKLQKGSADFSNILKKLWYWYVKKKQCCKQFEICFRSKNYRIWFPKKKNPSIKIIIAENQNC